jgi:hypothetical protein
MRIATFDDGFTCRLAGVEGDRFEPRDGETFLFAFPNGSFAKGKVSFKWATPFADKLPVFNGSFDRRSKTVSLEV